MNPLTMLKNLGQSVWHDNLRRGLITSGELKRMTEEWGVTGVTSNPTTFEKAIAGTNEYDEDISRLMEEGLRAEEILTRLVVKDIRLASEILAPAHRETGGRDGFVSVELPPSLAHDAEGSIKEAKRLFSLVNKPNIFVKVPGTVEGLKAIEELTYEGYSINITLLFSVERYEEVAWAYIRGLERRLKEGKPVDGISSVASFFVSRVDTLADKVMEEKAERAKSNDEKARLRNLLGKTAVASAKIAYSRFTEIFTSERFRNLKDAGAWEQRVLWASTGTKNPRYKDTKYVEELIQPGTVNTMPLATMLAFSDHGRTEGTLTEDMEGARKVMEELSSLGIDYGELASELEKDGVRKFAESWDALLRCIKGKLEALRQEKGYSVKYALNGLEGAVATALEELDAEGFLPRLWAKDPTLWKTTPDHKKIIRNALGWLTLPEVMDENLDGIKEFAAEVKKAGFRHAVLLGMGGSSLAPLVLSSTFGSAPGYPQLLVLDSTDPVAVKKVEDSIELEKALFLVSSKSGTTIEPLSLFEYYHSRVKAVKGDRAGENFVAITDPGTALEGFAKKYGFRRCFLNPSDIGGRFSALSFFGLVPAALAGIDVTRLLYHASCVSEASQPCMQSSENPVLMLGAALGALGREGKDKLTFFLSKEISTFGLWIEQLIAESTGKEGKGLVPVTNEPPGRPEDYGADRVFISISIGKPEKEIESLLKSLAVAGHPVIGFTLDDVYQIGGEFLRWEIATAVAGQMLGINPFDQPDVELAKRLTVGRLNNIGKGAALAPPGVAIEGEAFNVYMGKTTSESLKKDYGRDGGPEVAIKDYLKLAHKGDYIGILAYYDPMDPGVDSSLTGLRKALRDKTGAATQFGFGPRYLHSTGQLHKGGANEGLFLILCHRTGDDVKVPGNAFTFSELELSQAFGDMEALDSKGCRVALIEMKDPSRESLEKALRAIERA